jgi:hypothetical protein
MKTVLEEEIREYAQADADYTATMRAVPDDDDFPL